MMKWVQLYKSWVLDRHIKAGRLPRGRTLPGQNDQLKWRYRIRTWWLEICLSFRVLGTASKQVAQAIGPGGAGSTNTTGRLSAVLIKADGKRHPKGLIGTKVVTTAFVDFMVDQLQAETSVWGDFKFHDSGVGITAENITDTDMETTDAESRVTGTQVEGASANIYRSVGTISYTTTKAITEHGLFSIVTGGTLMDRTVFAAINVVNGDSIEFTYELTCTAGS